MCSVHPHVSVCAHDQQSDAGQVAGHVAEHIQGDPVDVVQVLQACAAAAVTVYALRKKETTACNRQYWAWSRLKDGQSSTSNRSMTSETIRTTSESPEPRSSLRSSISRSST